MPATPQFVVADVFAKDWHRDSGIGVKGFRPHGAQLLKCIGVAKNGAIPINDHHPDFAVVSKPAQQGCRQHPCSTMRRDQTRGQPMLLN